MKIIQPPRKRKDGSYASDYVASDSLKHRSKTKSQTKFQTKSQSNQFKKEPHNDFCDASKQTEVVEKDDRFSASELELVPGKKRRRSELNGDKTVDTNQIKQNELDPTKKEFNKIMECGIRLLAMREHSVKEMHDKLTAKADNSMYVTDVVDLLIEKNYLSDERFTESYVRARGNRGFGPVKIRSELKAKGISSTLIQDYLKDNAAIWFENAEAQYQKKYGDTVILDYKTWSKRARFLQSRGFTSEQIQVSVPEFVTA